MWVPWWKLRRLRTSMACNVCIFVVQQWVSWWQAIGFIWDTLCSDFRDISMGFFGGYSFATSIDMWKNPVSTSGMVVSTAWKLPSCNWYELDHDWLVVWNIFYVPYIGNNHPNWLIFFRGVQTTNQIFSSCNTRFCCSWLTWLYCSVHIRYVKCVF